MTQSSAQQVCVECPALFKEPELDSKQNRQNSLPSEAPYILGSSEHVTVFFTLQIANLTQAAMPGA